MDPDTTTPLNQAAVAMHEFYTELVKAGFTPSEALTLVAGMVNNGSQQ